MSGFRQPGPLCGHAKSSANADVAFLLPTPGPGCAHFAASSPPHPPKHHGISDSRSGSLPRLRKGSHGKHVRWLQILLNLQGASKYPLKPDGDFGPRTLDAVLAFQKSALLKADGIVGPKTWLAVQLIKAEMPEPRQLIAAATPSPAKKEDDSLETFSTSVVDWSLTRRFMKVVKFVPNHMKSELAQQFKAMLTPLNLSILVSTLVAWAVSHAFGVGEAADVVLSVVGAIFLGTAVFRAGWDIGDCLMITLNAQQIRDLDSAGDRLAQAVAILGVVAFLSLIFRVGMKLKRAAGAAKEVEPAPTKQETPPTTPKQQTPPPEPEPDSPTEPKGSTPASAQPPAPTKRPSFVPEDWIEKPSNKGTGTKYVDPENPHNSVRLEPAKPGSSNPGQQRDYMVVTKNGQTLDATGNPVPRQSLDSHIPQGTVLPPDTFK